MPEPSIRAEPAPEVRDDEAACRGSNAPWPGPSQRRRQETPGAKIGVWLAGYRPLANFVKFFKAPRKFFVLFYPRAQFLFLKKCALAFASTRQANLDELAVLLGPGDLARRGVHPTFGEVTLAQLLATWVVHDLNHVNQIVKTMAKAYGEAVGPWRAFLPLLDVP